jgi:hypothetical protein
MQRKSIETAAENLMMNLLLRKCSSGEMSLRGGKRSFLLQSLVSFDECGPFFSMRMRWKPFKGNEEVMIARIR